MKVTLSLLRKWRFRQLLRRGKKEKAYAGRESINVRQIGKKIQPNEQEIGKNTFNIKKQNEEEI